jgi:hypothetical protein
VKSGTLNDEFFFDSDGGCDGYRAPAIAGGVKLTLDRQTRGRGILMIAAALVMVMNVMIWTV